MRSLSILFSFLFMLNVTAAREQQLPLYFCTGANYRFFPHLMNLIASIHRVHFNQLGEIAVFNLGLTDEQCEQLKGIQKVTVHALEMTHPDLLTYFKVPSGHELLGWFAWKPVAIKQALAMFPYVLWLDAGSTVLRPLNHLFAYIHKKGHFVTTWGDPLDSNGNLRYPVGWGTTAYVAQQFKLYGNRQWILEREAIMGGIVGASRKALDYLIMPWYELTKDLRYFEDDGSAPEGYGTARHDQTLLSILVYDNHLTYFKQDIKQRIPMLLPVAGKKMPLYITWNVNYLGSKTHIYSSHSDLRRYTEFEPFIRYK